MTMPDDHENSGQSRRAEAFANPDSLCEEIETYISEKPLQSLAIALLAGIIVGKIIL